jgi:hypothetical protein
VQEGEYQIDIHAQGELLAGDKLDEKLHADTFTYKAKKEEAKPAEPEVKEEHKVEEKPADKPNNLLLYIGIGIGNLLLIAAIYFAYRFFIGGKAKDELAEFEKTLNASPSEVKASAPTKASAAESSKPAEKTEIDLSDEDPAHIPMNSEDSSLDKLFPLDSMDDPTNTEEKK